MSALGLTAEPLRCKPGRPPRPESRSGLRLPPLGVHKAAVTAAAVRGPLLLGHRESSASIEPPPRGRLGLLRSLRRSQPSTSLEQRTEFAAPEARAPEGLPSFHGATRKAGWGCPKSPRQPVPPESTSPGQAVRIRTIRRPADFGAGLGANDGRRSHSTSDRGSPKEAPAPEQLETEGITEQPAPEGATAATDLNQDGITSPAKYRAVSAPPPGASQLDSEAAVRAKARAVAALQKLFFEELAKTGGQDANGAAAAALRRLTEAPFAA